MQKQIEEVLNKLNIPYQKDVPLCEVLDERTYAKVQLNYINQAYEYFENKKSDLELDEFMEEFDKEERSKACAFFTHKYECESVK